MKIVIIFLCSLLNLGGNTDDGEKLLMGEETKAWQLAEARQDWRSHADTRRQKTWMEMEVFEKGMLL